MRLAVYRPMTSSGESARKSALYRIGGVLLLMVGFIGAGIPSAAAITRRESRPCGELTFEYSASRIQLGQAMDMELVVDNCSHHAERLRVHADPMAPVPSPIPSITPTSSQRSRVWAPLPWSSRRRVQVSIPSTSS
jgi:hypothetical protein